MNDNKKITNGYISEVKSKEDIVLTFELAKVIWEQHYTPIIGIEQVNYMLDNFQSVSAITKSLEDGYQYYILWFDDRAVGYFAIKVNEPIGKVYLSKLYVESSARGKGLASMAMQRILQIAKAHDIKTIWLNVNKNNTNSINVYEKIGFKKVKSVINPIGLDFVMDDYIMELFQ